MPNYINKIRISGTDYTLSASTSGGGENNVVELTQAEYDALVSGGTVDPTALYIITDAEEINANDYVTKAANTVSGSFVYISDTQYEYSDNVKSVVLNAGTYRSIIGVFACSLVVFTGSSTQTTSLNVSVDVDSNGAITGYSMQTTYVTPTILSNGDLLITANEGYCIRAINVYNSFLGYMAIATSSGQSKNVIENSIIPALNEIGKGIGAGINTFLSLSPNSNGLVMTVTDGGGTRNSTAQLNTSTIKWNSNGGSVYFETPEYGQVVLNDGTAQYINEVFNFYSYDKSYDDVTLTVNSATTNTNGATYQFRFINSSDNIYGAYTFTLSLADGLHNVDSNIYTYADITDTFSTDYKIKLTAKPGYKISYLKSSYRGITTTGASEANQNLCIVNLVTTTSNVRPGNEVIDDIYTKLSGIPTVTSAVTSGDTNAVAGGAVYDQVTIGGGVEKISTVTAASYTSVVMPDCDKFTISASTAIGDTITAGGSVINVYDKSTDTFVFSSATVSDMNSNYVTVEGTTADTSIALTAVDGYYFKGNSSMIFKSNYSGGWVVTFYKNADAEWLKNVVSAHTANTTIHVTAADKTAWNAKSDFSGSYNDLTNKPTIPTVTSAVTSGSTEAVESGAVYSKMGGLTLLKLTQSAYDALSPDYDSNTLYVIVN